MYYIIKKLSTSQTRSTKYPDGTPIPDALPDSYGLAQSCSNCAAYSAKTMICSTYDAMVLPNYWCSTWKAKE